MNWGCPVATNPIVQNVDKERMQATEKPETCIGSEVSPGHRAILEAALTKTTGRSFNEVLASMPNVGEDSDFAPNRD
jgi:hypothetical protein